jgi:beta-glucosidase/6-phospho-beta-glucosidase/beta-galactosidase
MKFIIFFPTLASNNIMNNKSVQVKQWITFVDPHNTATSYIPSSNKAPGINSSHVGLYLAIHTLIQSHSRAYHLYNNEFRDIQKGKIK